MKELTKTKIDIVKMYKEFKDENGRDLQHLNIINLLTRFLI